MRVEIVAQYCNSGKITMRIRDYIRVLESEGTRTFTFAQAMQAAGVQAVAVRAQLRRLKAQKRIAAPIRGFYVIIPPEYMGLGCSPAEEFIDRLMDFLEIPYYVALLSAAQRYTAVLQRPQGMQVMVPKNRARIRCGSVEVEFIASKDMRLNPVRKFNTPAGVVNYALPENTALELVGYPDHAGGLNNAASVIAGLAGSMDPQDLVRVARLCPVSWSQRLGWLLELMGHTKLTEGLAVFVQQRAHSFTPLRRAAPLNNGRRNRKWMLIVNADVEPDL